MRKRWIVTDITFRNGRLVKMDFYTRSEESRQVTFIYRGKPLQMDIVKGENYTVKEHMFSH